MGAYFTITAIAPGSRDRVLQGIRELESEGGDYVDVYSCQSGAVLCLPGEILHDSEGVAAKLSDRLALPVIALHLSDDVVWGYSLFESGHEVDCYSSLPNYWEELTPSEVRRQAGDASVLAKVWPDVSVEAISGYLTNKEELSEEIEDSTAYPEDQFSVSDAWQLLDFMKKLGLDYPFDEDGELRAEPLASMLITTPDGLAQKADFEERSRAVEEDMRRYREQL